MHGPFIWRKLIPTRAETQGGVIPPEPCLCPDDNYLPLTGDCTYNPYSTQVCIGFGNNPVAELITCWSLGGEYLCGDAVPPNGGPPLPGPPPIIIVPGQNESLCPREQKLEFSLLCSRSFTAYDQSTNNCINWTRNPAVGVFSGSGLAANPYFQLPVGETKIKSQLLCLEYGNVNPSDFTRTQIISGRNRDRYGGPLCAHYLKGYAMGGCDFNGDEYYFDSTLFGLTHIGDIQKSISRGSGAGQSRFGGTFPMEDAILTLPLFGALGATNPSPENPLCTGPCCDSLLPEGQSCFSCRNSHASGNGGYGHYLPDDQGSTAGYFSFACFNPQSTLYSKTLPQNFDTGSRRGRIEVPTCSLWALIKGIRNYIVANEGQKASQASASCNTFDSDINRGDGESWWINTDPGGTNSAGTSNVRLVMNEMAKRIGGITGFDMDYGQCPPSDFVNENPYHFRPPNVFLWDKDAFLGATASERWKHIYTIGYANILFDTGCTTIVDSPDGSGLTTANAMIYLDNTAHAEGVGLTHSSRMLAWQGCNGNPEGGPFFNRLRGLQCDGQDHGNEPDPNGFHCEDCLRQVGDPSNCLGFSQSIWQGYTGGTGVDCGGDTTIYYPCNVRSPVGTGVTHLTGIPDVFALLESGSNWWIENETNWQSSVFVTSYDVCFAGLTQGPIASSGVIPFEVMRYNQPNGAAVPSTIMKNAWGYRPPVRKFSIRNFAVGGEHSYMSVTSQKKSALILGRDYAAVINEDYKPQVWGPRATIAERHIIHNQVGFTAGYWPGDGGNASGRSSPAKYFKLYPPSVTANSISAGPVHGIVLKANGGVETFGYSGWTASDQWAESQSYWLTVPSPLSSNPDGQNKKAISVAAGGAMANVLNTGAYSGADYYDISLYGYSAAVTEDGSLYTWGKNYSGCVLPFYPSEAIPNMPWALAYSEGESEYPGQYIIPRPTDVSLAAEGGCTAVFAGNSAMAVITNSYDARGIPQYKVKAWGLNGVARNNGYYNTYKTIGICNPPLGLTNVKKVVFLGDLCAVALLYDGTISGWGNNPLVGGWGYMQGEASKINDAIDISVEQTGGFAFGRLLVLRSNGQVLSITAYRPGFTRTLPVCSGLFPEEP